MLGFLFVQSKLAISWSFFTCWTDPSSIKKYCSWTHNPNPYKKTMKGTFGVFMDTLGVHGIPIKNLGMVQSLSSQAFSIFNFETQVRVSKYRNFVTFTDPLTLHPVFKLAGGLDFIGLNKMSQNGLNQLLLLNNCTCCLYNNHNTKYFLVHSVHQAVERMREKCVCN